jgi:hypothetical protein
MPPVQPLNASVEFKEHTMKHYLYRSAAAIFVLGVLVLSAGPAPAAPAPAWQHGGWGFQPLAGQYTGTVTDSTLGTGTATANLAQSWGGVGGYFGFTFGSTSYTDPTSAFSWWQGLRGTFVAIVASSTCSFAYSATYNPSAYTLTGQYQSTNGCSGENGSFSLTQQCYYQEYNWNQSHRVHKGTGPSPC